MNMSTSTRRSKYDPIYALQIGQHFDVPLDPDDKPVHTDPNVNRVVKRTQLVPTSVNNLRVVLSKHAASLQNTGRAPKYKLEVLKESGVIRVTRMGNDYTQPKMRADNGDISPSTARNYEWLKAQDAKLAAAWKAAADYKATGEKPTAEQLKLLRSARMNCEALAAEAVYRLRTADFYILRKDALRKVHGNIASACAAVIAEARKTGAEILIQEEVHRIGGKTLAVHCARSPASEARRIEQEAKQLALLEQELELITDVPVGAVPRDRMAPHYEFNFLWWNDFAWTSPLYHPLQPGERARVCFMRPMNTSTTKPRIEDIERWVQMYNERWAKRVQENPQWGIEPPEYRLCGKFDLGGPDARYMDVRGLERIKRDPDSGAIQDVVLEWNMDDPWSLPIGPGKFQMVKVCTIDSLGNMVPCDEPRAVREQVKGLYERTGVQLNMCQQQFGYGKGVYLINRRDDGIDLESLRPDADPQDSSTPSVSLSAIMGE